MGLLIEDNEKMAASKHNYGIEDQTRSMKKDSPTQDSCEDSQIHRISGVAIEPANDEFLGRVNWRRRATAKHGEIPHAPQINCGAYGEKISPPRLAFPNVDMDKGTVRCRSGILAYPPDKLLSLWLRCGVID